MHEPVHIHGHHPRKIIHGYLMRLEISQPSDAGRVDQNIHVSPRFHDSSNSSRNTLRVGDVDLMKTGVASQFRGGFLQGIGSGIKDRHEIDWQRQFSSGRGGFLQGIGSGIKDRHFHPGGRESFGGSEAKSGRTTRDDCDACIPVVFHRIFGD